MNKPSLCVPKKSLYSRSYTTNRPSTDRLGLDSHAVGVSVSHRSVILRRSRTAMSCAPGSGARVTTEVVTLAASSSGKASPALVTTALFVIGPATAGASTRISMKSEAPGPRLPSSQVTTPAASLHGEQAATLHH